MFRRFPQVTSFAPEVREWLPVPAVDVHIRGSGRFAVGGNRRGDSCLPGGPPRTHANLRRVVLTSAVSAFRLGKFLVLLAVLSSSLGSLLADGFEEALASSHADVMSPRLCVTASLCCDEALKGRFGSATMYGAAVWQCSTRKFPLRMDRNEDQGQEQGNTDAAGPGVDTAFIAAATPSALRIGILFLSLKELPLDGAQYTSGASCSTSSLSPFTMLYSTKCPTMGA